ncbi:MAG: RlmE family RNA methyltransferase [Rickettsiales bacterium]|nr:RlmE family RNA methyltransferase [Rickettsiales bacterium]
MSKGTGKQSGRGGQRDLSVRVRSAKGRKTSSTLWLQRQLNDPYVKMAKRDGYRSRAAYKLLELDDKYQLLKPGMRVLDLGAAPGGWTQVAADRVKAADDKGWVLGVDILPMQPVPHATLIELDFMAEDAPQRIREALGGLADIVLSDMAPNTTGHAATDHIRILAMVEAACLFATEVLKPGGAFICKVRQGGMEGMLLTQLRQRFTKATHAKPKASRSGSAETFLVATGFKG